MDPSGTRGGPDPPGDDRVTDDPASSRAALGTYLSQGFAFAAALLGFTGLGYWLDTRLHTLPLLTILGAVLGAVGGFLNLYRTLTGLSRTGKRSR